MTASNAQGLRSVSIGDVMLRVVDRGAGIPILLVHGFPLDYSMWIEQIDVLAASHRVIAPDLRGFGQSQGTAGTVTMEQMATDLAALLDALAIDEPAVCCGLSMGGYVAFQFWRLFRDRLRALILCDTRAVPDSPEAQQGRYQLIEQIEREGAGAVARAMLPKLFAPATAERRPELVSHWEQRITGSSAAGIIAAARGLAERPDARPYLSQITQPTLVVVGEHDAISPVAEMRELASQISQSRFAIIPTAGHMSPLENAAAFNEQVQQFLAVL